MWSLIFYRDITTGPYLPKECHIFHSAYFFSLHREKGDYLLFVPSDIIVIQLL